MENLLYKKMTISYYWNLLTKWLNRTLGLISTLCLVRILSPEDFGLVALSSIILTFFVMLCDLGSSQYLIKSQQLSQDMLNSTWSLNIVLKLGCALVIILVAKPITAFMQQPQLYPVLLASTLVPCINAFKNIGLVLYEKELNFKPLTKLAFIVKLIILPITLFLAFYLQSYWALLLGLIISEILTVFGSYLLHPFRPCWSSKNWSQQWHFSKWYLLSVTSGFIRSRIDALLLGRFLSADAVGVYRISQEFAWLPFSEVIAPATSSLYSGFAALVNDSKALHQSILRYLFFAYIFVVPASMAIFVFAKLFTLVLLGEKWLHAAPTISMLALLMLSMPLNIALQTILTTLSKINYLVFIDILMISFIIAIIFALALRSDFTLSVYLHCRVFLVALFILLLCLVYKLTINISIAKLLLYISFPILPSVMMITVLQQFEVYFQLTPLIHFSVLLICGAMIYAFLLVIAMFISQKHIAECALLVDKLRKVKLFYQSG